MRSYVRLAFVRVPCFASALALGLAPSACAVPTESAPITRIDDSHVSPEGKKPICTIDSDPDTCGTRTTTPPGVSYDSVTVLTDTSARLDFSTYTGAVEVAVVVAEGIGSAPDDLASAKATPGAWWTSVYEPSKADHSVALDGQSPCVQHWYGLYIDGSLKRSGSFTTNPPGGVHFDVATSPSTRSATVVITAAPSVRTGYLDVELVPEGRPGSFLSFGDRHSYGTTTRTITGLSPSSRYTVSVHGCGASQRSTVQTNMLGLVRKVWATGEMRTDHATATAWLEINDAGDYHYYGWADEGGALSDNYYVTMSLDTLEPASKKQIVVRNRGVIHGKLAPGSAHDDWDQTGNSPELADAFDLLKDSGMHYQFKATTNAFDLIFEVPVIAVGAAGVLVLGYSCAKGQWSQPETGTYRCEW